MNNAQWPPSGLLPFMSADAFTSQSFLLGSCHLPKLSNHYNWFIIACQHPLSSCIYQRQTACLPKVPRWLTYYLHRFGQIILDVLSLLSYLLGWGRVRSIEKRCLFWNIDLVSLILLDFQAKKKKFLSPKQNHYLQLWFTQSRIPPNQPRSS